MKRFGALALILISLTAAPLCAQATANQSDRPSAADLIARAIAARKAQSDRGWKYTFREDHTDRQLDKKGNSGPSSVKTWEHIMLEGSEYRKLLLIDGKPLDAKTQRKVDEDLEKVRSERKKRSPLSIQKSVSLGSLELLARVFENRITGEETVGGRKTWRMESDPKPDLKPANKAEEEAMSARRVSWFDQEDGAQVRESNEFIRAANGFQPGSTFDVFFAKIGDDWLTDHIAMRADVKLIAAIHARVDSVQRYYDYKRFSVDSTMTPQ